MTERIHGKLILNGGLLESFKEKPACVPGLDEEGGVLAGKVAVCVPDRVSRVWGQTRVAAMQETLSWAQCA